MFSKKPPRWIISTIKTLILSMVVPLLSALPIFVPEVAQAATVGSGLCAQTVGSATGVTATQSGNDCIVTFTNAATTTWTAPNYLANLRYLVVAGGASGDRGQCSYYWGHGGGGGQVKDSTMSPVGGTAYTVTVGAGGGPTGGCTNAPNGNPGGNSVFASVTSQGGYAATATSYVGGTSGAGYAGGTGLSANLGGGGGGGAGGAGSVLNGGIGVTSNISGSTLMYGAGGAGKDNVGYGTAYGTDGVAVTNAGTEPPANTGMGGTDKAGWAVSTSGASGIVILR